MSDAYSNVVGGGLKLKGIGKKKKKKAADEAVEQAASAATAAAMTAAASSAASSSAQGIVPGGHTAAELRRQEVMMKREIAQIESGKEKSHRDKVKDFNAYLGNLTEHYDLPKVSKGN